MAFFFFRRKETETENEKQDSEINSWQELGDKNHRSVWIGSFLILVWWMDESFSKAIFVRHGILFIFFFDGIELSFDMKICVMFDGLILVLWSSFLCLMLETCLSVSSWCLMILLSFHVMSKQTDRYDIFISSFLYLRQLIDGHEILSLDRSHSFTDGSGERSLRHGN